MFVCILVSFLLVESWLLALILCFNAFWRHFRFTHYSLILPSVTGKLELTVTFLHLYHILMHSSCLPCLCSVNHWEPSGQLQIPALSLVISWRLWMLKSICVRAGRPRRGAHASDRDRAVRQTQRCSQQAVEVFLRGGGKNINESMRSR